MRRLALVLFGLALVLFAGRAAFLAMASEETKIRRLIERMADGFDDASANRATSGLARDWRDGTSGLEREWLRQGLIQFFHERRDPVTREFRYRVDLPPESLTIELDPADPTLARVECVARFLERGAVESLAWEVAVEAELERGPDGWEIETTRHRTLAGERLGR